MVYPVQRSNSYKRKAKKKKRSKLPFFIAIIIIVVIAIIAVVFLLHSNLMNSKVMKDDKVDYVFYMKGIEQIFFIRTDIPQKINYLISVPKISYEPIMAISMDQPNPREIFRSVEKLFGASDMNYYASMDEEAYKKMISISNIKEPLEYSELTVNNFVETIEKIDLSWNEFIFFSKTAQFIDIQDEDNFSKQGAYRLISNITKYANKEVPMTFMTRKPVKITLKDKQGESKEFERLYIDDKSLDTIMEFMKK